MMSELAPVGGVVVSFIIIVLELERWKEERKRILDDHQILRSNQKLGMKRCYSHNSTEIETPNDVDQCLWFLCVGKRHTSRLETVLTVCCCR